MSGIRDMTRRCFLTALGASSSGFLLPEALAQGTRPFRRRANIVVILADDLGYADLGCQGCREMVMGFDVHATALAAAGIPMPADKPLDGVDLLPYRRHVPPA